MSDPSATAAAVERHRRLRADLAAPLPTSPAAAAAVPSLGEWDYITRARLVEDTAAFLPTLPDVDLVVAIPRSGLVPGSLIAYARHVPLWTVSRSAGVLHPGHGVRLEGREESPPRRVLLVDDTVAYGREMAACAPIVRDRWPDAELLRAVIYAHPQGLGAIDLWHRTYPGSHYLEWNWSNAGHGELMVFDFDGILCEDCAPEDDDDGPRYARFLAETRPLFLPRRTPIHTIVTARHRKYEAETRAWLARWCCRVDHLVMRDWAFDPGLDWNAQVAGWKAAHFTRSGCPIMAESDPAQAREINRLTGKPVLCPAAARVFPPTAPPAGVGTLLRRSLGALGIATCGGCWDQARRMDAEGPAIVRERLRAHGLEIQGRAPRIPLTDRPAVALDVIEAAILLACSAVESGVSL